MEDEENENNTYYDFSWVPEDDEIVSEIAVYLTHSLTENLYLLQHPVRPIWRPYDSSDLKEIRYKQNSRKYEKEYRISHLELNQPGVHLEFGMKRPESYTITSQEVPNKSNYCVGILDAGELHLTPLTNIMQMRPSFSHVDDATEADAEMTEGSEYHFESEFQRREHLKSYEFLEEVERSETWMKLTNVNQHDDDLDFENIAGELYCTNYTDVKYDIPDDQYLTALIPPFISDQPYIEQEKIDTVGESMFQIMETHDGPTRLAKVLKAANIMQFSEIKTSFPGVGDDLLLVWLKKCSYYVRGVFVVNMKYLSDKIPKKLRYVHLYSVITLLEDGKIFRRQLADICKIHPDYLKTILEPFCTLVRQSGDKSPYWILKKSPDLIHFTNEHIRLLDGRVEHNLGLKDKLINTIWVEEDPIRITTNKRKPTGPPKITHIDLRNNTGSEDQLARKEVEAVTIFLRSTIAEKGVLSLSHTKQLVLQNIEGIDQNRWRTSDPYKSILMSFCRVVNRCFVLKSLDDQPDIDKYRTTILDHYAAAVSYTFEDLKILIKQKFNYDIPDEKLESILREFTNKTGDQYIFRSG